MSMQAESTTPVRDVSGYAVFSAGDSGAAHVMAHRMLDTNQIELGHALLGRWLREHSGYGSDWIHLHFHMAVFELELGDWDAACSRFTTEILPAAATTSDALTDAPALLWRLRMTAERPVELPWEELRQTAISQLHQHSEPFVELHNLLALAGAGDLHAIETWLDARPDRAASTSERIVEQMAIALRAYVSGSYEYAARTLRRIAPRVSEVGGSRAQNLLFRDLAEYCRGLAVRTAQRHARAA